VGISIQVAKNAAHGKWAAIANQVIGIPDDYLSGQKGPCPKCNDGTDRWKVYKDFAETGGAMCNQCGKSADGFALAQWYRGWSLDESIAKVCEFLGVEDKKPTKSKSEKSKSNSKSDSEPKKPQIEFLPWRDRLVDQFTAAKSPITSEAIKLVGGRLAKHFGQVVIAIPIIGPDGTENGYACYNATGGTIPYRPTKESPVEQIKIKIVGCEKDRSGWLGRFQPGEITIKCEGVSDMLAILSVNPDASVVTNPFGSTEDPLRPSHRWMLQQFKNEIVYTIHDLDAAGESGAMWVESANGKKRPGWAVAIAALAKESRHGKLKFNGQGKDVRDFLNDRLKSGSSPIESYNALIHLDNELITAPSGIDVEPAVEEDPSTINAEEESLRHHVDDPYRIAVQNLERYKNEFGRHLRYWKQTWYRYRNGGYQEITSDHLLSRLTAAIKREFDEIWRQEFIAYKTWLKSPDYDPDKDKGPPKARKIKSSLINDVYLATRGLCVIDASQKMHDWVREEESHDGICIACENGILNITKAISETEYPMDEILMSHRPTWFSTSKLNFPFDENAQCPNWIAFLNDVFNRDEETIDVLQKWFGYLLTPDNSLNKILFIIGQPRSGKGTIVQVMKELFGESNVATPKLTDLSRDFGLQTFADKTVAIIPDARLSKRADETMIMETLLSISGGDPQDVARKFKETLSGYQIKTRFTIFSNLVPNLKDLSAAFISRCIFLSMPNSYLGREDYGLQDRLKAELPGILNWAIMGRHNLNQSKRIKQPARGNSLVDELKALTSPLLVFLETECVVGNPDDWVDTKDFYSSWEEWCKENDVEHPGSLQHLCRKIKAINPSIETQQYRNLVGRSRKIVGLTLKSDLSSKL
jgi:P4 family phage/plasmid primase-like protien